MKVKNMLYLFLSYQLVIFIFLFFSVVQFFGCNNSHNVLSTNNLSNVSIRHTLFPIFIIRFHDTNIQLFLIIGSQDRIRTCNFFIIQSAISCYLNREGDTLPLRHLTILTNGVLLHQDTRFVITHVRHPITTSLDVDFLSVRSHKGTTPQKMATPKPTFHQFCGVNGNRTTWHKEFQTFALPAELPHHIFYIRQEGGPPITPTSTPQILIQR